MANECYNTCLRVLPNPFSLQARVDSSHIFWANECCNTCLSVLPNPFSLQARVDQSHIFRQMNAITPASASYLIIFPLQVRVPPSRIFWQMNAYYNTCLRVLPNPFSTGSQSSPISYLLANECYNTCLRVLPNPFSHQARVDQSYIFWQMNVITPASASYLILFHSKSE